jgi:hypothetical protein
VSDKRFVVIEYDNVEIGGFGKRPPDSCAGDIAGASVVWAATSEEAITRQGRPGYFAAFPLPEGLNPVHATVGVER